MDDDRKEACRNEGSFICETDVREVQGDQEERQNHDHLREPEAQTKTGLITDSRIDSLFIKKRNAPDLTGRFMTVGTALWPEEPADMIRGTGRDVRPEW